MDPATGLVPGLLFRLGTDPVPNLLFRPILDPVPGLLITAPADRDTGLPGLPDRIKSVL